MVNSPIIASICFELRKYGCGLWQATQVYEQIGQEVRAAILVPPALRLRTNPVL